MVLTLGQELRLAQLRMKRGLPPPEAWRRAIEQAVEEFLSTPRDPNSPLAKLGEHFFHGSPEDDHAGEALGRMGWTVPGWAMYQQVRELAQITRRRELDAVMVRAYARRSGKLAQVVASTSTSPHMLKWLPLYRQTLHQYRRRQYLVSVPALLLIFEGLLTGFGAEQSKPRKPRILVRELIRNEKGSLRCAWLSLAAFTDQVYANHRGGAPKPDVVNRHLILHGKSAPLWGRADCLRLIQALDTLCGLFSILDASRKHR